MLLRAQSGRAAACLAALLAASSLGACATKGFVRTEVGAVDTKLTATQGQVAANQTTIQSHDTKLGEIDTIAKDAMARADAATKLAEGKFTYSVVLQDDAVKFPANSAKLSPEAEMRLSSIADKLKTDNKNVYIEVQGHTSTGEAARLGDQRAEAVRMFLNKQGVPLNRIGSISYGATTPVAPNDTRDGRAQNRRAVVMVLA
jgi:outer membrane protein OmpA-like peptidoglycan-associated protein